MALIHLDRNANLRTDGCSSVNSVPQIQLVFVVLSDGKFCLKQEAEIYDRCFLEQKPTVAETGSRSEPDAC